MQTIAETLRADKVLIPSAYQEKYHPENARHHSYHDPFLWTNTAISHILDHQEYLGHTVLGKTICENFKTKKRRKATEDELLIFPNTHEAIIDQDTWDMAQRRRNRKPKKLPNGTFTHRLSGMVFCADCGARMSYSSPEVKANGRQYDSNSSFQCSRYRNIYESCTSHFIKASSLEMAILAAIREVVKYVLENEESFVEELKSQWKSQETQEVQNNRLELAAAEKRMTELDMLIKSIYENHITGKLPERQLQKLMEQYDDEQAQLEKRIDELHNLLTEKELPKIDTARFIALVKKYKQVDEVSDAMLNELIDKIVVHQATGGRTAYRQQKIEIHFNFIGCYQPPAPVVSEEQRIADIEACQREKKAAKQRRAVDRANKKRARLREAAKYDPQAAAEYEHLLQVQREAGRRYQKKKAKKQASKEE